MVKSTALPLSIVVGIIGIPLIVVILSVLIVTLSVLIVVTLSVLIVTLPTLIVTLPTLIVTPPILIVTLPTLIVIIICRTHSAPSWPTLALANHALDDDHHHCDSGEASSQMAYKSIKAERGQLGGAYDKPFETQCDHVHFCILGKVVAVSTLGFDRHQHSPHFPPSPSLLLTCAHGLRDQAEKLRVALHPDGGERVCQGHGLDDDIDAWNALGLGADLAGAAGDLCGPRRRGGGDQSQGAQTYMDFILIESGDRPMGRPASLSLSLSSICLLPPSFPPLFFLLT